MVNLWVQPATSIEYLKRNNYVIIIVDNMDYHYYIWIIIIKIKNIPAHCGDLPSKLPLCLGSDFFAEMFPFAILAIRFRKFACKCYSILLHGFDVLQRCEHFNHFLCKTERKRLRGRISEFNINIVNMKHFLYSHSAIPITLTLHLECLGFVS